MTYHRFKVRSCIWTNAELRCDVRPTPELLAFIEEVGPNYEAFVLRLERETKPADTVVLSSLPKGARFRFVGEPNVFAVLDPDQGNGAVKVIDTTRADALAQVQTVRADERVEPE